MPIQPWVLPILGSALLLGIYDVTKKQAVKENSVMPALFWATFAGSVFFLAAMAFTGRFMSMLKTADVLLIPVLIKSMIVSFSWVCVYYAMRELPVSIAAPIRATSPLWVFAGGLIFYGEIPTVPQGCAMILIFAGYYLFSVFGKLEGISFRRCKGIHLIFLGTLVGSASALYDKYLLGVKQFPSDAVQFWFSVWLVVILGAAYAVRRFCFPQKNALPFQWRLSIPLTGILLICADFLYFHALSCPDTPVSILSLVRRSNCIVAFTIGSIWFHEKNKGKKSIALAAVLIGVAILALAKSR